MDKVMSKAPEKPQFTLAGPADSAALLEILEQDAFPGPIQLIYSRRPDAWASLQREGRAVLVYKRSGINPGIDTAGNIEPAAKLDGFGACAINTLLIDGKPEDVGYLFSFRIRQGCERSAIWLPEGYRFHFQAMRQRAVNCFLTSILSDNLPAIALLEKKRRSMPVYQFLGEICTVSRRTRKRLPKLPKGWLFRQAQSSDLAGLLAFWQHEGRRYQFLPVLSADDLLAKDSAPATPPLSDWFILYNDHGEITACGARWDQREYKPYIVAGYKGIFRWLQPLSAWLSPLLGLPLLPTPGGCLPMFCASFLMARNDKPRLLACFLDCLASTAADFGLYSFSMHADHPAIGQLRRHSLVLKSRLYRVWEKNADVQPPRGLPYIEIGRL